jgi:RNA polymerase sigma factor (sigma-70 family)
VDQKSRPLAEEGVRSVTLRLQLWTEYIRQVRRAAQASGHRDAAQRRCERLVVANLAMVDRIARTVARKFASWIPMEDFVQAGRVGLVEAARRYPGPTDGFERYAYRRVRGAMIDAHKRRAYREELHESLDEILDAAKNAKSRDTAGRQQWLRDPRPLPLEDLAQRERRMTLFIAARRRLPDAELQVFMATMHGMDVPEIALKSGRSVAWVRAKLVEVRRVLRAAVEDRAA